MPRIITRYIECAEVYSPLHVTQSLASKKPTEVWPRWYLANAVLSMVKKYVKTTSPTMIANCHNTTVFKFLFKDIAVIVIQ